MWKAVPSAAVTRPPSLNPPKVPLTPPVVWMIVKGAPSGVAGVGAVDGDAQGGGAGKCRRAGGDVEQRGRPAGAVRLVRGLPQVHREGAPPGVQADPGRHGEDGGARIAIAIDDAVGEGVV